MSATPLVCSLESSGLLICLFLKCEPCQTLKKKKKSGCEGTAATSKSNSLLINEATTHIFLN